MKVALTENGLTNLTAVCDQENGKQAERLSERCREALAYGGGITIGRVEMVFTKRDQTLLEERTDPDDVLYPWCLRVFNKDSSPSYKIEWSEEMLGEDTINMITTPFIP